MIDCSVVKERVARKDLWGRIGSAQEAASLLQNGMLVAFGGYSSSGYPKAVAKALRQQQISGEKKQFRILSGANNGPLDSLLAEADLISWRAPMIESKSLAKKVNAGRVDYLEQQMSRMPRLLAQERFGQIDVAVVEVLGITQDSMIIPTSSVGVTPLLLEKARRVIIEINLAQPETLWGMHDIYLPGCSPVPMTGLLDRIGHPSIPIAPEKILRIVPSEELDEYTLPKTGDIVMERITDHLLNFLELEYPGRELPPLQTGFGNMANEIANGLERSNFSGLSFLCGGMQAGNMRLLAQGKVSAATAGAIQMTPEVITLLRKEPELFRKRLVLRNAELTNGAEIVSRMGILALNSGLETDIYGNVNSSHLLGTKVVNGIGGGAGFAENAALSILLLPAEGKHGAISHVVPMVPHQDIGEHDVDVIITENGVADLRKLDDVHRAQQVIECCTAGCYRDMLRDYFSRACRTGGHHPQLLEEAFSWHLRFQKTGTMRNVE